MESQATNQFRSLGAGSRGIPMQINWDFLEQKEQTNQVPDIYDLAKTVRGVSC